MRTIAVIVAGLRRWQKGFFNTAPFSGDTFFQLEIEESMTDKGIYSYIQVPVFYNSFIGKCLSFGIKCRVKHSLTQQYISVINEVMTNID